MTLYLSMNGVGSYLQLPSMTIKKIVIDGFFPKQSADFKILFDTRTGLTNGYVYARLDGTTTSAGANFAVTNYGRDTRRTVEFNAVNTSNLDGNGNFTDNVTVFANNTFGENFVGSIYNIKCYNALGTLVAHYDMNTGTVQDQTGNGYHATLVNGSWVDDAKMYYLSMDGIDDILQLPSMTASSVVIDCYINSSQNNTRDVLFDARTGGSAFIDIGFTNLKFKINGGAEQNSHTAIPKDSRNVLDIRSSFSSVTTWTDNTTVFAKNDGTTPLGGKIYNVKLYNDTTLMAHYDMLTGHAQDISGNGYHATLTGGTWVEDVVSGGSVIDAGTITLTSDGSLTSIGSLLLTGDSTFSADTTFSSIGSLILNGDGIFDAVSSLTIEAEIITPDIPINLSADSSLSVEASIVYNGVVTLSADTSLDAVANLIINGISSLSASGSLTVEGISYDPSKQIITKIQLNGVRELTVKSEGQRELTYQVTTTRNLITRLEGES